MLTNPCKLLSWGSVRAKTSTGHFIPWKYHSIEKWQYIFLNWYEATDQEGSCVLEETQLQSSTPHERGHATDRSEKGRAGLRADGYDDSATISVALRRHSQERPDVSKQGEKTFLRAVLEAEQDVGTRIQVIGSSEVPPRRIWQRLALALILIHVWEATDISSQAE